MTKQNALFLSLVVMGWLLFRVRWRLVWVLLPLTAVSFGPALWLNWITEGWFAYYVIEIAYASPIDLARFWPNLLREVIGAMGGLTLAGLVSVLGLGKLLRDDGIASLKNDQWAWLIFMGAVTFVSLSGRSAIGGNLNNLLTGYAPLCLTPALMTRWMSRPIYVWVIIWVQFGLSLFPPIPYAPAQHWPTAEMQTQGDRLIEYLAAVEGEVLVMLHPHYAQLAGKEPAAHIQTLWHARRRGAEPLPPDLVQKIEEQAYAVIISDKSLFFEREAQLEAYLNRYYEAKPLDATLSPHTLSGIVTRPQLIYTPK